MLRILLLSMVEPASHSGAATVTRNFIRLLESDPIRARVECLAPAFPSTRIRHRWKQAVSVAKSLAGPLPAKAAFTHSRKFRQAIETRLRKKDFDLVIVNGGDLLWTRELLPSDARCILIAHNIEHLLARTQADLMERSYPLLRPLLRREQALMKRFETQGMAATGNAIFLSVDDARYARANSLVSRSIVVPPVFYGSPGTRSTPASSFLELGFLANQYWWPNREGLEWFLRDVFPAVQAKVRLHLFGPGTDSFGLNHPHLFRHGSVRDLDQVWNACDLMICPILHGGGVSIKVAESLYNGVPVLATPLAARGLELADDPSIAIREGATEWADFLESACTADLRERRVPAEISDMFTGAAHVHSVGRFLSEVLA